LVKNLPAGKTEETPKYNEGFSDPQNGRVTKKGSEKRLRWWVVPGTAVRGSLNAFLSRARRECRRLADRLKKIRP
jgi:hypothetical protein